MIDIKYPERFFNPLVSKHQKYYIEILLQTEKIISNAGRIALERSIIVNELKKYIEHNNYEDISDEEDYAAGHFDNSIGDNLSYILRMFKRSGWIDSDDSGNRLEDAVFITDAGKELTLFLSRLMKNDEQAGYVLGTYNNLAYISSEKDSFINGYVSIKNAFENTESLLRNLEMMYSKIRRYYNEQLEHTSPEELLRAHFNGYINEIINKVIFPLKVDDSIYRFKGPIIEKTEEIIENSYLIEEILSAAKQMKRISDVEYGKRELLRMLNYIREKYRGIESIIDQLDDKINAYTRVTRQKLTDMLSMDTTVKGNLIYLLKDGAERNEAFWRKLSACVNIYDVHPVSDLSLYRPKKPKEVSGGEPFIIEEDMPVDNNELYGIVNTYASNFTKAKVEAYAEKLLNTVDSVSSDEIEFSTQDDYVMSLFLMLDSDDNISYKYHKEEGQTETNGYSVPRFRIIKKGD